MLLNCWKKKNHLNIFLTHFFITILSCTSMIWPLGCMYVWLWIHGNAVYLIVILWKCNVSNLWFFFIFLYGICYMNVPNTIWLIFGTCMGMHVCKFVEIMQFQLCDFHWILKNQQQLLPYLWWLMYKEHWAEQNGIYLRISATRHPVRQDR